MIDRVIRGSLANRPLVLLLTLMLCAVGAWSVLHTPVDALPDLSDVQVIVRTPYPGQAPRLVEDQVTYPLTTSLLSVDCFDRLLPTAPAAATSIPASWAGPVASRTC